VGRGDRVRDSKDSGRCAEGCGCERAAAVDAFRHVGERVEVYRWEGDEAGGEESVWEEEEWGWETLIWERCGLMVGW